MPRRNYKTKPPKHVPYELNPHSNCDNKKSYTSEQEANWAAHDQMKYDLDTKIAPYYCDDCHKWHLTSRKNKD